ncbi:hypothetical protein AOB46_19880 [Chryseobacterium indologenes]|uniref:Uncharacterized protein n=1 Tax=Chryseobacterium indologenes TaxID=253 RepID=A0A0N0ZUT3_CHRID|nr:hypothetical protein AOB46_19880 [Chryseobacterium indologenes]
MINNSLKIKQLNFSGFISLADADFINTCISFIETHVQIKTCLFLGRQAVIFNSFSRIYLFLS